jgi:chemotaxis protein CheX
MNSDSLQTSLDALSDLGNLDATVHEVFNLMIGVCCGPVMHERPRESETITAVVGFAGFLSGACVLRVEKSTAVIIAEKMTGMEFIELDDMVKDAMGEICNMLAGAWKGRRLELAAECGLSIPAVITGRDYDLHVPAPEFRLHRGYSFQRGFFEVTIAFGVQH